MTWPCEILTFNLITDTYELRIGKQIVNRGETSAVRMADVINPRDSLGLVNNSFITNFYDVKRGLWMLRFLYTPYCFPLTLGYLQKHGY